MIITNPHLASLTVAYSAAFSAGLGSAPSQYDKIAMTIPSTTSQNTYPWLGQIEGMREWLGDRVIQNLNTYDYSIKNRPFEKTIAVKRDDIEDDNYGVYAPMFTMMGAESGEHPNELVFGALKDGHQQLCFDGQYFFDTDHPVGEESVSNLLAPASDPGQPWFLLCTSRPVRPLIFQKRRDYVLTSMDKAEDEGVFMRGEYRYGVDARVNVGYGFWQTAIRSTCPLDSTGYAHARSTMMGFKKVNSKPIGLVPDLLVVPPTLEGAARRLLKNATLTGGGDNEWFGTAEVLVAPWLA